MINIGEIVKTKRLTKLIICFLLLVVFLIPQIEITSLATYVDDKRITSEGAIVIDFESGMELFEYNADVRRVPSSMAKMMTVYLVYEAIAEGKINFSTVVPISATVAGFSQRGDVSNVKLYQSETYTVDDLLNIAIISSASGACTALGELVAGTAQRFHQMMNDKAEEWGIDAFFSNAYGGTENTQLTPRAMATLVRNTLLDYPEVLEKTSLSTVRFQGRTLWNTNRLLGVYDGIDGFKTGTSPIAGENFSGTAERDGIRIISITMGSNYDQRYNDTVILLDYGFAKLEEQRIEENRITHVNVDLSDDETDYLIDLLPIDDPQITPPAEIPDDNTFDIIEMAKASMEESNTFLPIIVAEDDTDPLVTSMLLIGCVASVIGMIIVVFIIFKKKRLNSVK